MHSPQGFSTVTPYFFVEGAEKFCEFLVKGLNGRLLGQSLREDGKIANAQVRLGEATVMVSEAGRGFDPTQMSLYLYVGDAHDAMARAISAGATSIMEVADMPYGDRQGGVTDPQGNLWWISQRLTDEPYF